MTDLRDDFLSALWAACTSLVGRAILYMLAWVLGIMAAYATAQHEFVCPWMALREVFFLALMSIGHDGEWAFILYVALLGFQLLFLWKDIHWGFLLIPFLLVWLLSHRALVGRHW